jgi:histidyl-tRNA synthetase
MPQAALPGFRDFYPQEFAERAWLTGIWRDVARRFAFVEFDGPPLEPLEIYTRKSGDEIVGQLYNFSDKGGREVALRPEMTPTFARMIAARAQTLRKPVRWFSIPQLFRYERQQKGRLREHFQLNVDVVGEAEVAADAELLALAVAVMRQCGLSSGDVVARVSDRRLLNALLPTIGIAEGQWQLAYAALDKVHREPRESLQRKLEAGGIASEAADALLRLAHPSGNADRPALADDRPELREHVQRLEEYFSLLGAHGIADWVQLDLSIVRGLDYYTGIVFELYDRSGEFRAICGGGRYDDLIEQSGGPALPALGFGMGDVVLTELLRARGLLQVEPPPADYWIATEDNDLLPDVIHIAAELRNAGASAEYALRRQPLARQLRSAGAAGVRRVVILKRDSWPEGRLIVKNMEDSSEAELTLGQLLGTPPTQDNG